MRILIRDIEKNIVFENLDSQCYSCEQKCTTEGHLCKCPASPEKELRQGKLTSQNGSFFLCDEKTFAKTTNLFKEKLGILVNTTPAIKKLYGEVQSKGQERYEKIVHNLKTLNAQSIQEQYSFISQEQLADNYQNQLALVVDEIKKNPEKAAIAFIRLTKNNANIKTEFAAHEKLSVENPVLSKSKHSIRKVILNVYHSFDLDFKDKDITVLIPDFEKKLIFDYETMRLALYHLFGNASKYIKRNTTLKIDGNEIEQRFLVTFDMDSIHIEQDEIDKIFEDGYSGVKVKATTNRKGTGLGMGLIKKALHLNDATIKVVAGNNIEAKKKVDYSNNKFIISFKTD
jgi:light-regulated signal transduction histidine kinase (bacteriophytochrome)